jgi:hypothetical protein
MEYFFYGRDRPGVPDLRHQTMEAHWSFMDGYRDAMIARGPTLAADDDEMMTGSLHLVDLPDAQAAHVFAYEEPFFKAGVFAEVLVRRWSNRLGRTMWDFTGIGGRRFMILGHGNPTVTAAAEELQEQQLSYMTSGEHSDALITYGPLQSETDTGWLGTVALVELPDRPTSEALMNSSPYARAGLYTAVEIHNWRFGGRPTA